MLRYDDPSDGCPRDAGTPSFGSGKRPVGDPPSLSVGDKVTHDSNGPGVVVGVEGAGPDAVVKVDLGADGTKRMLLRYCPVTRL